MRQGRRVRDVCSCKNQKVPGSYRCVVVVVAVVLVVVLVVVAVTIASAVAVATVRPARWFAVSPLPSPCCSSHRRPWRNCARARS